MSSFDNVLQQSFLNMVGLTEIVNSSGNTILLGTLTNTSTLNVSGSSIINNNITANSNCNVLGNTVINNNVNINSNLNVSGSTIINNNLSVNSNLNLLQTCILNNNLVVSGNSIFNGPVSINSILNISGSAICSNILTNNIQGNILNIYGNTIYIGNSLSNVYINGTSLYDATTQIETIDKIITLNANPTTYLANDIGNNCGINIVGISGTGFIQTSTDATRFIIKTPISDTLNYILTQDTNYNINISGASNLLGPTNINNLLTISGNTILNNNITVLGGLYISGQTILQNNTTIMGVLNVSNNAIFNKSLTTNVLNVSGNATFNNTTTILSILNISGNNIISGTYSNLNILNVSNDAILCGSTSILNSLYVSGTALLSNLTINSNLSVSGTTVIANSLLNNSNLNISGTVILNSATSLNSSLTVSNTAILNSNLTALGNLNILGQITATLPSYSSNTDAKNNGVPVWGLYINGAILMVRLNDVLPIVYLSGLTTISIPQNTYYTDTGAYALDYQNNYSLVYLSSILSSTGTNYLSNNILINGTSTLITQTSILSPGNYTGTYQATDSTGLLGYNYRIFNVLYNLTFSKATFSASSFSTLFSITNGGPCIGLTGVYYTGGTYVALPNITTSNGPQDANIWTSTDYYNWTCINIGSLPALSGISKPNIASSWSASCCAFGNNYLALKINNENNDSTLYFIYNISANTLLPFPSNGNNYSFEVTNINNYCFYIINNYIYSTDGNTFTQSSTPLPDKYGALNYVNGVYMIAIGKPTQFETYISTDRINWTVGGSFLTLLTNNNITYYYNDMKKNASYAANSGNMCIYAGISQGDIINRVYILSSTNGVNWTIIILPYFPLVLTNYPSNLNGTYFDLKGAFWNGNVWIVSFLVNLETLPSGYVNPYGSRIIGFYFSQNGIDWNISTSLFYQGTPAGITNNSFWSNSTIAKDKCILPISNTNMTTGLWYNN